MYLFICVTAAELGAIVRDGLPLSDSIRERFETRLESAELRCTEHILVANRDRLARARSGRHGEPARLTASDFANADPYVAPRRVDAAGGYLVRPGTNEPELLLIFRRGRWDLPKGKLDAGETIEDCAVREVREELGISRVQMIAPLGCTLHGYRERGRYRVKTTHWFLMRTSENRFRPQTEEDIEHVEWMPYTAAMQSVGFDTLRKHMQEVRPVVFEHLDV